PAPDQPGLRPTPPLAAFRVPCPKAASATGPLSARSTFQRFSLSAFQLFSVSAFFSRLPWRRAMHDRPPGVSPQRGRCYVSASEFFGGVTALAGSCLAALFASSFFTAASFASLSRYFNRSLICSSAWRSALTLPSTLAPEL